MMYYQSYGVLSTLWLGTPEKIEGMGTDFFLKRKGGVTPGRVWEGAKGFHRWWSGGAVGNVYKLTLKICTYLIPKGHFISLSETENETKYYNMTLL